MSLKRILFSIGSQLKLDITWNVQMDGSYCDVNGKTNTSVWNAMQQHQMQRETLFNTITRKPPPSPHPHSPTLTLWFIHVGMTLL